MKFYGYLMIGMFALPAAMAQPLQPMQPDISEPVPALVPMAPMAEEAPMAAPKTPAAPVATAPAAATPTQPGYGAALELLTASLKAPMHGDADVDFVRLLLAQQQASVAMAKHVLAVGSDPDVRMLAGDVLKVQTRQVEMMQGWMDLRGPNAQNTMPTPAPAARVNKPRAPAMRSAVPAKPIGQLLDEVREPKAMVGAPVANTAAPEVQENEEPPLPLEMPLLNDNKPPVTQP